MDVHNKETRSYNMSCIKGKDTKPEEIVRKYLFSQRFRYRKNDKRLPGTPDIVLPKYKTVIFVNGCFWHGHTIIEEGLHFEYDESKLQKALNYVLKTDKYSDQKIDFPATFLPKRKFLPVPRCPKCHNIMLLTEENGRLKYVCSNVSCDECYEAVIN